MSNRLSFWNSLRDWLIELIAHTSRSPDIKPDDDDDAWWPRADSTSRYHSVLRESATSYPRSTEALMRADRHRPRRWHQFIDDVDLKALESLLKYLATVSSLLEEEDDTGDLTFLPNRIADDIRISIEGLLSGYLQVASDAMRDIIETELLIRDFSLDSRQISRWRAATEDILRRNFQPVHLRQRQANALGVDIKDVPSAKDYAAHSKLLHVSRPLLYPKAPESGAMAGHTAINILDSLADIMHHGASAVEALDTFMNVVDASGPNSAETLATLSNASEDLRVARSAVEAVERIISEQLSENGSLVVTLFESGLVIVFDGTVKKVSFYKTNRVDFRTFHRGISEDQHASFKLTTLGEGVEMSD